MLSIHQLDAGYGEVRVLHDISLEVQQAEVVAVLGANGAGKTTLMRTISGFIRPAKGSVSFEGRRIDRLDPEVIAQRGVIHVPQGRRVFPGLTVYENLVVGTATWRRWGASFRSEMERVFRLFPRLEERKNQLGWSLSGGEQQMLAMGRAIMSRPRILLLDEPSLGLAPLVVEEMYDAIQASRKQDGMTIVVVEQNTQMALQIADRGYVVETGQIVLQGTAAELMENPKIQEAYLGG